MFGEWTHVVSPTKLAISCNFHRKLSKNYHLSPFFCRHLRFLKKTRSTRPMAAAKRDYKNKNLDFFYWNIAKKYYFRKRQGNNKVKPNDPHPCPCSPKRLSLCPWSPKMTSSVSIITFNKVWISSLALNNPHDSPHFQNDTPQYPHLSKMNLLTCPTWPHWISWLAKNYSPLNLLTCSKCGYWDQRWRSNRF